MVLTLILVFMNHGIEKPWFLAILIGSYLVPRRCVSCTSRAPAVGTELGCSEFWAAATAGGQACTNHALFEINKHC